MVRLDVNKLYVVLGIAAIVMSVGISGARSEGAEAEEVEISPHIQSMCCGTVTYNIHITNNHRFQRAYDFRTESPDSKDIWISLEPKTVLVPSGQEEDLVMFVRAGCDLPHGDYRIRLIVSKFEESLEREVLLRIPGGCARKQPEKAEQATEGAAGQEVGKEKTDEDRDVDGIAAHAPAGAAVTVVRGGKDNRAFATGLLLVLLGVLSILIATILRGQK